MSKQRKEVYASEDDAAKASDALMFTHRSAEALVGGRFFTRVAHKVAFKKMTPRAAIDEACAQMSEDAETGAFVKDQCRKGIAKFNEATDKTKALSKVLHEIFPTVVCSNYMVIQDLYAAWIGALKSELIRQNHVEHNKCCTQNL